MAAPLSTLRYLHQVFRLHHQSYSCITRCFASASVSEKPDVSQNSRADTMARDRKSSFEKLADYRFAYAEFLPDPRYEHRHKIREKLERVDMLKRRSVIDIPEFYVGSVLSVKTADPFSAGKENKFVGICIARSYLGLRANFTLRNIVDNQGVEIMYDLYNPTIQQIEVLRLEKRLDDELYYLRDAPPEYSTFPFNMEPEYFVVGEPVKVNPIKVKLKPKPWNARWELRNLKGVEPFEEHLSKHEKRIREKLNKPWEKYDIMKEYRESIPEEDQEEIWEEVEEHRKHFQQKQLKWKQRVLLKAKPLK